MPRFHDGRDLPVVHVCDAKNAYRRVNRAIRDVRDLGIEINVGQARQKIDQAKHNMMSAAVHAAQEIITHAGGTDLAYEQLRKLSKELSRVHLIEQQNSHLHQ